jgi:hypothetical protein
LAGKPHPHHDVTVVSNIDSDAASTTVTAASVSPENRKGKLFNHQLPVSSHRLPSIAAVQHLNGGGMQHMSIC